MNGSHSLSLFTFGGYVLYFFIMYLRVFLPPSVSMHTWVQVPAEARNGCQILLRRWSYRWLWLACSECWEWNLDPLQEEFTLLTDEEYHQKKKSILTSALYWEIKPRASCILGKQATRYNPSSSSHFGIVQSCLHSQWNGISMSRITFSFTFKNTNMTVHIF